MKNSGVKYQLPDGRRGIAYDKDQELQKTGEVKLTILPDKNTHIVTKLSELKLVGFEN